MAKKRLRDYSMIIRDNIKVPEPGDRKIINTEPIVDRSVFQKTEGEKKRLKLAKRKAKLNSN